MAPASCEDHSRDGQALSSGKSARGRVTIFMPIAERFADGMLLALKQLACQAPGRPTVHVALRHARELILRIAAAALTGQGGQPRQGSYAAQRGWRKPIADEASRMVDLNNLNQRAEGSANRDWKARSLLRMIPLPPKAVGRSVGTTLPPCLPALASLPNYRDHHTYHPHGTRERGKKFHALLVEVGQRERDFTNKIRVWAVWRLLTSTWEAVVCGGTGSVVDRPPPMPKGVGYD